MGTSSNSRHVEISKGVDNLRDCSDDDSDSVHDKEWAEKYYNIADDYKHLVSEVAAISQGGAYDVQHACKHHDQEPAVQGRGKIYRLHGREGGSVLGLESRCNQCGYTYVPSSC